MVVVLVGLLAGTAFAVRYDSGYQAFSGSPHGQYSTATTKCAACHAVHNPGSLSGAATAVKTSDALRDANIGSSEALLRGTIANACSYCHVSATFPTIKTVYAQTAANYTTASGFGHTSTGGAMSDLGVNCTDCHQVHGASTAMASTTDLYMYRKILKSQPAYDSDLAAAFGANGAGAANQANLTRWCTGCHNYYEAGYNGNSHIMGPALANYANGSSGYTGRAAYFASTDCRSCHQNGVTDALATANGANNYPHFTSGYRFLNQADSSVAATAAASAPGGANTADRKSVV